MTSGFDIPTGYKADDFSWTWADEEAKLRARIEELEAQVREMREAGLKAADIAESWVRDQLEGTSYLAENLAEVVAIRAMITGAKPEAGTNGESGKPMDDYRIEAATKAEWAERAIRAEATLAEMRLAVAEADWPRPEQIAEWAARIEELERERDRLKNMREVVAAASVEERVALARLTEDAALRALAAEREKVARLAAALLVQKKAAQDYCWQRYEGRQPLDLSSPAVFTSHEWQKIGETMDAALASVQTGEKP